MKRVVYIFLLIVFSTNAQNLVPNPSFETITTCNLNSAGLGSIGFAPPWNNPTISTPDLMNLCSTNYFNSVPSNGYGYQVPNFGNGYAGCVFYDNNN